MLAPTIKDLLDLQAEIRRKVEDGVYVVDVDQLPQLTVLPTEIAKQNLHSRIIQHGPATG